MALACAFAFIAVALATPTFAEVPDTETGTLNLLFEDGFFYNDDRDYTTGWLISWTTSPDDTPEWAINWARHVPFFGQSGVVRATYGLGQDIFDPNNFALKDPPTTDHPYAGFLYGQMGLAQMTDTDLDQLQVEIGAIGPMSIAGNTQIFVHAILGDQHPNGWHYQLRDEPGLVINDEHSWRAVASGSLLGISFDVDPHLGGAIGNVYDYVNAGAMGRIGINLPDDYGPLRVEPSLPGTSFFEPTGNFSAYLFTGVDGRLIARNIFLDGNTFENSRHVDRIPYVGDFQTGLAIAMDRWRLAYTHVFRTKEFTTQQKAQQFGAVNLSIRF
jgi:lipid A 3-O-deacylase